MADLQALVDQLSQLSIVEAATLSKMLEEKWGVSAAMPVAVGPAPGVTPSAPVEEQTSFDLVLIAAGEKRIEVIKAVREITGLGLKESKDIVENVPKGIKEAMGKADAEAALEKLKNAGATVELR